MDIGGKIKNARIQANFTQEKAAERLGVSRQTISNWENERTYPDIISVVKMSDLYHISLDRLLKEEEPMSDYLNYLKESTNVVESRNKLSKMILIVAYLGIWAVSLMVFWFFTSGSDAMGYGIMFLWVLLPVTTLIISMLIGRNNYWGKRRWICAIAFGVMYMLAEYATFGTANMIAFKKINLPQFGMLGTGAMISLFGLGISAAANRLKFRGKGRK